MRRTDDEPRLYGPYEHGDRFRVHVVTGRGGTRKTAYETFQTRAAADAFIAGARDESQGFTVRLAVKAYLDGMRERGCAESSIESAEDRLALLLDLPANDSRPLRWANHRGFELYAQARGRVQAADTHINALHVGKTWGAWCAKRRMIRANPFELVEKVGRKKAGEDQPRLTTDESRRLAVYCLGHASDLGAILTLGYVLLGSRASELVTRTVRDLDDNGTVLLIGKTKSKAGRRQLALPPVLAKLLAELARGKAADARLFDGWTRFSARLAVQRVCKAAGVPVVGPQALRRTQATIATEAGVAALAVSAHLGHAGTEITKRVYAHPNATADASTARALRVIAGGKR